VEAKNEKTADLIMCSRQNAAKITKKANTSFKYVTKVQIFWNDSIKLRMYKAIKSRMNWGIPTKFGSGFYLLLCCAGI
jgi:hypothetical protein